jgi:outer membrane protein assembly factor BamB
MQPSHREQGLIMRKSLLPLGLLAGALTVSIASPAMAKAAPSSWAQDGYGPGNTGDNPAEHTITSANVASLRYRWSLLSPVVRGSCMAQSPPVVADGRLFLPDQAGIGAYNAVTGTRLWRRAVKWPGDQETPKLAVIGSTLLAAADTCGSVSDPDGDLTAYNAATGATRWTLHRDAPIYQMVVERNVVVLGGGDAGDDVVSAYRLSDGKQLWTRSGAELGSSVSAGGRLLLTKADHTGAFAADLVTGKVLWSVTAQWSVLAADLGAKRFFAADPGGRLFAVNAATGAVQWSVDGAGGLNGGLAQVAADAARIYASQGEHLIALRLGDGEKVWDRDLFGEVGRPVVAGDVVYVTAEDQPLTMLEPSTGNVVDDSSPIADGYGHPVIVDGRLYVTSGRLLDAYGF